MASRAGFGKSSAAGLRALIMALLAALPAGVCLLNLPPGALAACGSYGYLCTQTACLRAEIWTPQGWKGDSATIYGTQGSSIDLHVRTLLSTNIDLVEGWSFGLEHSAPTVSFVLNAAQTGPDALNVQNGNLPDFEATQAWSCGFTQGVVVDFDEGHTMAPASGRVVAYACYQVTVPDTPSAQQVTLQFTDDVGSPPIESLIIRSGQPTLLCNDTLTLYVQKTGGYPQTPSYNCPFQQPPFPDPPLCTSPGGGGGGGVSCTTITPPPPRFMRGDTDASFDLDATDAVVSLNWLFRGQAAPPCQDAADVDDTGTVNITDPIRLLNFLFGGGPPPAAPHDICGVDPTADDALPTCSYVACPENNPGPNVSKREDRQCETTIAINPCNEDNIVTVSNNLNPGRGLFRAVSFDGGVTWPIHGLIFDAGPDEASADPYCAFDAFGNLHVTYLGEDDRLHVAASVDGGVTFPNALHTEIFDSSPPARFVNTDRPAIATGPAFDDPAVPGDSDQQSVWLVFQENLPTSPPNSNEFARRIAVAGASIVRPLDAAGPAPAYTVHEIQKGFLSFADIAVGPNGDVIVAYQEAFVNPNIATEPPWCPANIFLKLREPAAPGNTSIRFRHPTQMPIATTNICGSRVNGAVVPMGEAVYGLPQIEWHHASNRVYLSYMQEPNNINLGRVSVATDSDIYLRFSDGPQFATWSSPRVIADTSGTEAHHAMAIDQSSGRLFLSWYGNGEDVESLTSSYFVTYFMNDGMNFRPPYQVSACQSGAVGLPVIYLGNDYTALASLNNRFFPCWGDRCAPDVVGTSDVLLRDLSVEKCNDGLDNDVDGQIDAADPVCMAENCFNGLDDDLDGAIDCLDPDCCEPGSCQPCEI